jgi:histone deacetylase 11
VTPIFYYSPRYDFSMFGIERLHPFDARKFSRAFSIIERRLGPKLERHWREPDEPVTDEELLRVHSREYLDSLRSPAVVAKALELWPLKLIPHQMVERSLLLPMRLAVRSTMLAVQHALESGASAMNLGGGFHHAFREHGEGFCVYADVAIAIAAARARGTLTPAVHVLDLYNFQIYPGLFPGAVEDFPFQIPLKAHTGDAAYLETLREELPKFLSSVQQPRFAIYNAGTDIVAGDPLGRLDVSQDGVKSRDRLVLDALAERNIPVVIVTSGGYTEHSHALVADLALRLVSYAG